MKKYAIFIFLISIFSAAYSQDAVFAELKKQTLVNDSLQKVLQTSNDSIGRLNSANKTTIAGLNNTIDALKKDTADLHKEIKKLDKSNIKSLETGVQQKSDSIKLLKDTIKNKDAQFAAAKTNAVKKQNEKYEEGRQDVYSQIRQIYQTNTFDNLIKSTTKQSVDLDLQLVGDKDEAGKKLSDLRTYFAAQQVLGEKYDEQTIKAMQSQLNSVTQTSDLVDALKKKLSNYKLCVDGLKTTIEKINHIDKTTTANDDYTQKTKLGDILSELSSYFRNYFFNFTDYPYLSGIVLEIMKLKQKDANTDISGFSSKL